MLPCRFMDANGNGSREQAIKCMDWCLKREAHVLSNSWGEVPNSLSLQVWRVIDPERPPAAAPRHLLISPSLFFPLSLLLCRRQAISWGMVAQQSSRHRCPRKFSDFIISFYFFFSCFTHALVCVNYSGGRHYALPLHG
jgi:hypothetical protein